MKKVSLAQASSGSLAKYTAELDNEIVVVTRGRKALAALVPLTDVDREALALSTNPEFLTIIRRARAEVAAGKAISLQEMRSRLAGKARGSRSIAPKPSKPKRPR